MMRLCQSHLLWAVMAVRSWCLLRQWNGSADVFGAWQASATAISFQRIFCTPQPSDLTNFLTLAAAWDQAARDATNRLTELPCDGNARPGIPRDHYARGAIHSHGRSGVPRVRSRTIVYYEQTG